MHILVKNKTNFTQYDIDNVTNIEYTGTSYILTYGDPSAIQEYNASVYTIVLL